MYITCLCFHLIMNEILEPNTKKHIRRLSVLKAGFRPPDLFCMHDACYIKKLCTGLFFPQSIERPVGIREFISWNPAEESLVSHCNRDMKSITSTSFSFLFTNWLSRSDFICKKNDFFPKKKMKIHNNTAPLNEPIYLWQPHLLVQIVFL